MKFGHLDQVFIYCKGVFTLVKCDPLSVVNSVVIYYEAQLTQKSLSNQAPSFRLMQRICMTILQPISKSAHGNLSPWLEINFVWIPTGFCLQKFTEQ